MANLEQQQDQFDQVAKLDVKKLAEMNTDDKETKQLGTFLEKSDEYTDNAINDLPKLIKKSDDGERNAFKSKIETQSGIVKEQILNYYGGIGSEITKVFPEMKDQANVLNPKNINIEGSKIMLELGDGQKVEANRMRNKIYSFIDSMPTEVKDKKVDISILPPETQAMLTKKFDGEKRPGESTERAIDADGITQGLLARTFVNNILGSTEQAPQYIVARAKMNALRYYDAGIKEVTNPSSKEK